MEVEVSTVNERDIKLIKRREIPYLQATMYCFVYFINICTEKISDHYPKIYEDSPKVIQRPYERFRTFSDNQRVPETFEKDPKMFRSCTNNFKYKSL